MSLRLPVRYAAYFTLLATAVALGALAAVALTDHRRMESLRQGLTTELQENRILNEEQALRRSGRYLSNRLFNPLHELDVSRLNEEIAQIRTWLPVVEFLVLDEQRRVLTDGSARNRLYGQPRAVPSAVAPGHPVSVIGPDGPTLAFAVGHGDTRVGYAVISLADEAFDAALGAIEDEIEGALHDHRRSLAQLTASTLAGTLLLGGVLSWLLSRRLSRPLQEMTRAARRFSAGDLQHALTVRSRDELGDLARSLNAMARDLRRNRRVLERAQEISGFGTWEWHGRDGRMIWSPQVQAILGHSPGEGGGSLTRMLTRLAPEHREAVTAFFAQPPGETAPATLEVDVLQPGGGRLTTLVQGEHVVDPETGEPGAVGTLQDITEQRRAQEQLAYLARYDPLTGLPNRYLLEDRLAGAMSRAGRSGELMALLFLDLDRFKSVNDALGHPAGDELLRQVAQRLPAALRASDTVARLGGDEFLVVLEQVGDTVQVASLAESVLSLFQDAFHLGQNETFASASIGVTVFPGDAESAAALLKNADAAMYRAKELGRGGYHFFTEQLNAQAQQRLLLENRLRLALERDEFELWFQPQLDLASGRLRGAEALLRWRCDGRLVGPVEFVPVLEDTGLIVPVGGWVLEQACAAARQWRDAGLGVETVAVNLAARQLRQPELVASVEQALARHALPAHALEVEVTESSLVDGPIASRVLEELAELGVSIAIDDFGTGYSSLSYLKRFAVDILKIDRSFVNEVTRDPDDDAIATAIIALAHSLGISVIAEGVETPEQLRFLETRGCDAVQGYLAGRPMPAASFVDWVQDAGEDLRQGRVGG